MNNYIKLANGVFIFIACTFLLLSCSNENEHSLKKETLVVIMTELMITENLAVSDSVKAVKIFNLMQNNNINLDSLKNILAKFENNPEFWHSIYNSIKIRLKESPTGNL